MQRSGLIAELLAAKDPHLAPQYDALHRLFTASILVEQQDGQQEQHGQREQEQQRQVRAVCCCCCEFKVCTCVCCVSQQYPGRPLQQCIEQNNPNKPQQQQAATAVLLSLLLRWGGDPLSVQTVLSAYTSAAVRVAQHLSKRAVNPAGPPAGENLHEQPHDQARGRRRMAGAFAAAQRSAEAAVGALVGLQGDMRLLDAACGALQRCPDSAADAAAAAGGGDQQDEHMAALRSYWLDRDRGMRWAAAAAALWSSGADGGRPGGAAELVAAAAAAVRQEAAAVAAAAPAPQPAGSAAPDSNGRVGSPAAAGTGAALPAQQLACALLVQPRWRPFCSALTGSSDALLGGAAAAAGGEGDQSQTAEFVAAVDEARDQLAGDLAALLKEQPSRLLSLDLSTSSSGSAAAAAAAMAGACWAHAAVRRACLEALGSAECVKAASESVTAASRLRGLVGVLHGLGCLID
jgi:hypothetical protein